MPFEILRSIQFCLIGSTVLFQLVQGLSKPCVEAVEIVIINFASSPVRGVQLPRRVQAVEVAEGLAAAETASEKATVVAGTLRGGGDGRGGEGGGGGGHIVREAKEGFLLWPESHCNRGAMGPLLSAFVGAGSARGEGTTVWDDERAPVVGPHKGRRVHVQLELNPIGSRTQHGNVLLRTCSNAEWLTMSHLHLNDGVHSPFIDVCLTEPTRGGSAGYRKSQTNFSATRDKLMRRRWWWDVANTANIIDDHSVLVGQSSFGSRFGWDWDRLEN